MCHAPTGRCSRLAYRQRLAPWSPPSTGDLLPLPLAASDDLLGMRRNIISKFLSTSRPRLRCGDGFRTRSMSWYGRKWSTLSFLSLSRPTQLVSSSPHSLTCDSIRRERQHIMRKTQIPPISHCSRKVILEKIIGALRNACVRVSSNIYMLIWIACSP